MLMILVSTASMALAFQTTSPTQSHPGRRSIRLNYRDDANPQQHTVSLGGKSSGIGSDDQETVDAYLEFLERRYCRLHSDEKRHGNNNNNKKRAAPGSPGQQLADGRHTDGIALSRAHDALYVLGVAGLASEKLLRRSSPRESPSTEAPATTNNTTTTNNKNSKPLAILAAVLARGCSHTARFVLRISGGQQAMLRTIALASAAAVITRHLFQVIVTNGLAFEQFLQ